MVIFERNVFHPFTWLIFLGYCLLLGYFYNIDNYHNYFFVTGSPVIFYHLARFLFIFFQMWLFYTAGNLFLRFCNKGNISYTLSNNLLSFFSGVGLWHIVLLFMGLNGFYTSPIMIVLTCSIFLLSIANLDQSIKAFKRSANINWQGCLIVALPLSFFLITKGFFPAGGHDYYTHYFQFYKKVIASGSTAPNEVWYHFYYSKGAGLFFLAMLLTDPLGPQLATTAMILGGCGVIYSILKSLNHSRLFPWIGMALYITFLIYTPGPIENLNQGGWGDMEKPHEPTAVLVLSLIWLTIGLYKNEMIKPWGMTLLLTVSAAILITPVIVAFIAGYLFLALCYFWIKQKKEATIWLLSALTISIFWFVFLMAINYFYTGIPIDQGLIAFWPIINLHQIKEWGVMLEVFVLHFNKSELINHQLGFNFSLLGKILTYLRLDIWWPFFSIGLFALIISKLRKKSLTDSISLYAFSTFIILVIVFSFILGRVQSISFYRFTSFTYAPMLCLSLILISQIRNRIFSALLLICAFLISLNATMQDGHFRQILKNGAKFTIGRYSIADAYRHQEGWPGRMPWGGIYPAAEVVWSQLAPNTRIWSMNVHSYCMLPDCQMESYMSYRFTSHPEIVYFADPEKAKLVLKEENLNYFFIANSLQLTDPLPLSPLFSPKHISQHLGIAWTDGDNTLLTWKENASSPIDSLWLDRYNRQIKSSPVVKSFPYSAMKAVLNKAQLNEKLKASEIPWNPTA